MMKKIKCFFGFHKLKVGYGTNITAGRLSSHAFMHCEYCRKTFKNQNVSGHFDV